MSTTQDSTESKALSSTTTTAPYLTSSTALNYELQVTAPPIDATIQQQINQLLADLTTLPLYTANPAIQHYCTDTLLYKYIRARPQSLDKAKALLIDTLQWRQQYRPDLIVAAEVQGECSSGKILVKGHDQYGRPLMVMNNHYNKTHDHDAAIRQLVFQLELASQRMVPPVERYATHITYTTQSIDVEPESKTTEHYIHCRTQPPVPPHHRPPCALSHLWCVPLLR